MKTPILPEAESFAYRDGRLFIEDVAVEELAERFGTPLYAYSLAHVRSQYERLGRALGDLTPSIHYAVKANSCGALIRVLAAMGAGADVVSGGELFRARRAGIPAHRIVFAGVGKTVEEIEYALREDIGGFTVESEPELERLSECARRAGTKARIAIRVNPDVAPQTHIYTSTGRKESKFGVDPERARRAYERAATLPGIEIAGMHMHLGSPLADERPYAEALDKVAALCVWLKERFPTCTTLDLGGGMGIPYRRRQKPFDLAAFAAAVVPRVRATGLGLALEPGRYIVGNAGLLVARVQYIKENAFRRFVITDAGMNDLIRPPLYHAWHEIVAVRESAEHFRADIVGPICESGDFLAQGRRLPAVREGDLVAVMSAGAYGFAMASNYNSRGRAAEVVVERAEARLARRREGWADLVAAET
jgi:diaminopimelate decarboxylase